MAAKFAHAKLMAICLRMAQLCQQYSTDFSQQLIATVKINTVACAAQLCQQYSTVYPLIYVAPTDYSWFTPKLPIRKMVSRTLPKRATNHFGGCAIIAIG
jgi:hypothetical protein